MALPSSATSTTPSTTPSTALAAPQRRTLLLVSALATLAGLAGVLADLALEYTSQQSALFSPTYQYLVDIPQERLLVGHFLGVAAITLEISGFWVASQLARAGGVRSARLAFLTIAFGTVVGVAFHGSVAMLALLIHTQRAAPPDAAPLLADAVARADAFIRPLAAVAVITLAVWSIWYAVIVARGRTLLPRWLALCNPLLIALLCRGVGALVPAAALVLAPTALNIASTSAFLAITLALLLGEQE